MMYQQNMCYIVKDLLNKQIQRNINNYIRFASNHRNINGSFHSISKKSIYKPLYTNALFGNNQKVSVITARYYADKLSSNSELSNPIKVSQTAVLTNAEKLKKAVKEYGSTVIVFHIGISLMSLGVCYALVSSGVDFSVILDKLGLSDGKINKLAGNTGTFVIAYAVHKVFAPVRIGITLTATPFIVRYLRNIGWLKK